MAGVIEALESVPGRRGSSTFSPREHHANLLEHCVEEYNAAKWAKWRRSRCSAHDAGRGDHGRSLEWRVGPPWGLAVATFTAVAWMASFSVRGLFEKGALFLRCRQYRLPGPARHLADLAAAAGRRGLWPLPLPAAVPPGRPVRGRGPVLRGFYMLVDRKVEAERRPPISQVEQMLRSMRLRGLEEGALRQFVCTYSGEDWEGFFEALFGYDAKMVAREKWGLNSRELPRETALHLARSAHPLDERPAGGPAALARAAADAEARAREHEGPGAGQRPRLTGARCAPAASRTATRPGQARALGGPPARAFRA